MTYSRVKQIARDEGGVTNRADVAKRVDAATGVPAVELLGLVPWNPESRDGWDPDDGSGSKPDLRLVESKDGVADEGDEREATDEPTLVPVPGLTASVRVGSYSRPSRSARS